MASFAQEKLIKSLIKTNVNNPKIYSEFLANTCKGVFSEIFSKNCYNFNSFT